MSGHFLAIIVATKQSIFNEMSRDISAVFVTTKSRSFTVLFLEIKQVFQ